MWCLTDKYYYVNTSKCYSELTSYFELVTCWNVFNFQDILFLNQDC